MKKLGIILDSFSGRERKEIEDLGFYFLPQQVIKNNKSYTCNEGIKQKEMAEILKNNPTIQTSQPSVANLELIFKKASAEHEKTIFLPIQKNLSSTYSTAVGISQNFKNIFVIENHFTGGSYFIAAKKAQEMYENGYSIEEIKTKLEDYNENETINFVLPFSIDRLINSGRLKGAKKYILKLGLLLPILSLTNVGFKSPCLPKRTFKGCIKVAIQKAIQKFGIDEKKYQWEIHFSGEKNILEIATKILNSFGIKKPLISLISPVTSAHTGPGVGLLVYKKEF